MSPDQYVAWLEQKTKQVLDQYDTLVPVSLFPKRRVAQPRFKISLERKEDLHMRIAGSFIYIGPEMYYVREIFDYKNDFWLIVQDANGLKKKIAYKANDLIDLRTPDPQYVLIRDRTAYLTRFPGKQQAQGISSNNIYCKRVGSSTFDRCQDMHELAAYLKNPESLSWQSSFHDLMVKARAVGALRLSTVVAFYRVGDTLQAEYKGRFLGHVQDNTVTVDKDDYEKPWVRADLHEIGCTLRQGNVEPKTIQEDY